MIYLINLPIGIAAFVLANFAVDESASTEAKGKRLETVGTRLVTLALLTFSIPFDIWERFGLACLVVGELTAHSCAHLVLCSI